MKHREYTTDKPVASGGGIRAIGHRVSVVLAILVIASCVDQIDEGADSASVAPGPSLATEELQFDFAALEEKILGLAEVFSEATYDWRPAEGVRSSGEVFMHIAAVNYAFPMIPGYDAPVGSDLTLEDFFGSMGEFEGSATSREEILATLQGSFEHLESAMRSTYADMDRALDVFGTPSSVRGFWWIHFGHLHEHLGQLIAYSRSNGIAPPWS